MKLIFLFIMVCAIVESGSPKIELSTDRSVYKIGEPVLIHIKNMSLFPIRDSVTLNIKDEDGKIVDTLVIMTGWSPIHPLKSIEHEWNQKGKIDGYGQVKLGKYTISASCGGSVEIVEIEIIH